MSYSCCVWLWAEAYLFSVMSLSKWPPGGHIRFFSFRTLTLVWLWMSSPNFIDTSLVCMGRSLLIFSDITFKMAAWQPYLIFFVSGLFSWHGFWSVTLDCFGFQFHISYSCCLWSWTKAFWFKFASLSKWPPGGHIGFFSFWILTVVCHWISSPNFSSKLHVLMERSLLIFRNVTFKMYARRPYWIFQFPDTNFSLALNIKSKRLVAN